ncbi:MAG: NlpC/P60 family protein [Pseudomonadota bacterium]
MSQSLDSRLFAYRTDLADIALQDRIKAERYVKPAPYQVAANYAPVRRAPRFDAPLDTQALYGHIVNVFEIKEGWAWAQLQTDGYVGYIPENCLSSDIAEVTHCITAPSTFVYPAPDIKTPPLETLTLNASINITEVTEKFVKTSENTYIYAAHTSHLENECGDFVHFAENFKYTPYLWGGCTYFGIDCSGLVQLALHASGHTSAPRDSDMQLHTLGTALPNINPKTHLKRGDLVFWKGHVGIMTDNTNLLHANGYHMQTVIEPLEIAVKRIAEIYGSVVAIKRF